MPEGPRNPNDMGRPRPLSLSMRHNETLNLLLHCKRAIEDRSQGDKRSVLERDRT